MDLIEQEDAELNVAVNKHWREVAEYERYTKPLLVRLRAVEWADLLALHSACWRREAVEAIRARTPMFHYCSLALSHQELIKESQKRKPSGYNWLGSYYNARTGKYRQIQCYPLLYMHDTGTYPIRFCPLEGQPVSWGSWFRTSDVKSPGWTPEAHAWRSYEKAKELYRQVLGDIDVEKRSSPHRRQYLADCLRSSSQWLGRYSTQNYAGAGGFFSKETYELDESLDKAVGGNSRPSYLGALSSYELGEVEAKWEHFQQCLREFHEAEKVAPVAVSETPAKPARGTPTADVRHYFPKAATIHGTTATDANALNQLAVWLLHWAERPNGKRYSLAGQLREQLAAHPDPGKFLKACRRLHEALTPLAATETAAKALLGKEYNIHSSKNLQAVLKWWAGWIRERTQAHHNPAGAYLAALKRMPIVEEQNNGTPCYSVPIHLLDWDGFAADIAPLRQAFDDTLLDLTPDQKRTLRHDLGALLSIDGEQLKRRQELFDRQEYFPANLPADYPSLRFEVAGQSGGLSHVHQWVGPMFWNGLRALLQYKQMEASTAFEKLNAVLGEILPVPKPPKHSLSPDTSQPGHLPMSSYPWEEIEDLAEKIGLRKGGRFTLAGNRIAAAGAGLIDALLDASILPNTITRPVLYAEFSQHYGQSIKADRAKPTREYWHQKARKELGLPDLKPPKLRG